MGGFEQGKDLSGFVLWEDPLGSFAGVAVGVGVGVGVAVQGLWQRAEQRVESEIFEKFGNWWA